MKLVEPPRSGVWRVGRGPDPLAWPETIPASQLRRDAGNRFDSPTGGYRVLYFSTHPEGCYGETLGRFRPSPLADIVRDEWRQLGFMDPFAIPADWRDTRLLVQVSLEGSLPFVDVDAPETHRSLRRELALVLGAHQDLDIGTVRGPDRNLTRMISHWVWLAADEAGNPLYGGIRYESRITSDWECWAVFEGAAVRELQIKPILRSDPSLKRVAALYELTVH